MSTFNRRIERLEQKQGDPEMDFVAVGTLAEAEDIYLAYQSAGRRQPTCIITGVVRPAKWSSWRDIIPQIAAHGLRIHDPKPAAQPGGNCARRSRT